MTLKIA